VAAISQPWHNELTGYCGLVAQASKAMYSGAILVVRAELLQQSASQHGRLRREGNSKKADSFISERQFHGQFVPLPGPGNDLFFANYV
jgi:hypothetical protein